MKKTDHTKDNPGSFRHFLQCYMTEDFFVELVSDYCRAGLERGEACVVVVTPSHALRIREVLERSVDLEKALQTKKLIVLDAEKTLAALMVKGKPNPGKFYKFVGSVVDMALLRSRHVRAFGEMVVLLCRKGNERGALELEKLWSELGKNRNFSLLCSYPDHIFADRGGHVSRANIFHGHEPITSSSWGD